MLHEAEKFVQHPFMLDPLPLKRMIPKISSPQRLETNLLQYRDRLPVHKEDLVNIHEFDHRSFTFLNAPHTSSAR